MQPSNTDYCTNNWTCLNYKTRTRVSVGNGNRVGTPKLCLAGVVWHWGAVVNGDVVLNSETRLLIFITISGFHGDVQGHFSWEFLLFPLLEIRLRQRVIKAALKGLQKQATGQVFSVLLTPHRGIKAEFLRSFDIGRRHTRFVRFSFAKKWVPPGPPGSLWLNVDSLGLDFHHSSCATVSFQSAGSVSFHSGLWTSREKFWLFSFGCVVPLCSTWTWQENRRYWCDGACIDLLQQWSFVWILETTAHAISWWKHRCTNAQHRCVHGGRLTQMLFPGVHYWNWIPWSQVNRVNMRCFWQGDLILWCCFAPWQAGYLGPTTPKDAVETKMHWSRVPKLISLAAGDLHCRFLCVHRNGVCSLSLKWKRQGEIKLDPVVTQMLDPTEGENCTIFPLYFFSFSLSHQQHQLTWQAVHLEQHNWTFQLGLSQAEMERDEGGYI